MKRVSIVVTGVIALIVIIGGYFVISNNSNSKATAKKAAVQKKSDYNFYKDAKSNSRIYYILNLDGKSFGKDTSIYDILYIKNGKYKMYDGGNHTLTDLKGLSDKQVLSQAKKWDKASAESFVTKAKDEANKTIATSNPDDDKLSATAVELANKNLKLIDEYKYTEPEAVALQIGATTDSSGNNLDKELIYLPTYTFKIKNYFVDEFRGSNPVAKFYYPLSSYNSYLLSPTQNSSVVYDKTYSYGNLTDSGTNLVLATQGTQKMKLDNIKEKGIHYKRFSIKPYTLDTYKDKNASYITWK